MTDILGVGIILTDAPKGGRSQCTKYRIRRRVAFHCEHDIQLL